MIIDANNMHKQDVEVFSNSDIVPENVQYNRDSKICAWINIIYGCDKFCTYCIVPFTRGRERSRKQEEILEEVKSLKANGYMEVTLLGQNVNAYGKDLELGYDFADLLENVAKIGIPRIRFVTSHPWNFTDRMIDVIAKYPNIMPYIHLPIQSGSDEILKKMNRKYTISEYKNLFDSIKKKIPNVSVTTDIIVGFPGETEEDFQKTLDIVNYCKYDGAYTFIFSPRVGTAAAKMPDETPIQEKEMRLQRLNELVNKYSLEANKKLLGKTVEVLVLKESEKDKNKLYGYTDTMKLVNITNASSDIIGKIKNVYITDAKSFSLDGEYIGKSTK
jgi:tRNA-2-methylthio-N6-dimethylallyladenosine synthase